MGACQVRLRSRGPSSEGGPALVLLDGLLEDALQSLLLQLLLEMPLQVDDGRAAAGERQGFLVARRRDVDAAAHAAAGHLDVIDAAIVLRRLAHQLSQLAQGRGESLVLLALTLALLRDRKAKDELCHVLPPDCDAKLEESDLALSLMHILLYVSAAAAV